MKIIIEGDIAENDLILFAKFLKTLWKNREDKLFIFIESGMHNMSSEECQELFKKVFSGDKDWSMGKLTLETQKEFLEKMSK